MEGLAGGGSVAVAVGVSDRRQVTCDTYPLSICRNCFIRWQTGFILPSGLVGAIHTGEEVEDGISELMNE